MSGPTESGAQARAEKSARTVEKSVAHVKDSASHIRDSASNIESASDRSTELAADRTLFAAERTYAAWVRTGLGALASGVGARALLAHVIPGPVVMFTSTILVLFSTFCFCAAVWRELVPRFNHPVPKARRIPRAILFFINGSLALVTLAVLAGIWALHGGEP